MTLLANYCKETFINIGRNLLMSLASVTTIAASLVVLGALYLFVVNVNRLLAEQAAKAEIFAFFRPQVSTEAAIRRVREIRSYAEVENATYLPKDQILRQMTKNQEPEAQAVYKDLPLPSAVEVKTNAPEQVTTVASRMQRMPEVHKVNFRGETLKRLLDLKAAVNTGGIIAVLLLGAAAFLTVNNTIHLTITSREQEIAIMQLVGATAWYIKVPFLLEGMFHGFVGAALSAATLLLGYVRLHDLVNSRLPFLSLVSPSLLALELLAILLGAGVVFGFLGSYVSVRRLLHVG